MTHLEAAWESVNTRHPIGLAMFCESVKDWTVYPVTVDGQVAGAVLTDGPEIHACILPFAHGKWLGRWVLRLINELIEQHGYAQTHASTAVGVEFVTRLGFTPHDDAFRRTTKWALKQS